MAPTVTKPGLRTALTNVALATLYLFFLVAHVRAFEREPRLSIVLMASTETLFAVFFLMRRDASSVSFSAMAWSSTIAGTFLPVLLRPVPDAHDIVAAQTLQIVGTAFSVYGIASLNRSIGLLPANRGIRTTGAYRLIRHPLYASYTLANLGYLGCNPSRMNALICVAALGAQVLRIVQEERLLLRDAAYSEYAAAVRWRLLPYVF